MKLHALLSATAVSLVVEACGAPLDAKGRDALHATTDGAIAVANLDHQIAQHGGDASVVDLLLARSRFLDDYAALDRALAIAERRGDIGDDLLRRARVRSAAHRF